MNKLILIISLFFISNCFGQDTKGAYYTSDGVSIYIKPIDCSNPAKSSSVKQYLMIEVKNTTNQSVKVSFNKEVWYNNVCQTCNSSSNEYKSEVIVAANSSVQGACDDVKKDLKIFSKMLNHDKVRKLTKYELKNITIENIK